MSTTHTELELSLTARFPQEVQDLIALAEVEVDDALIAERIMRIAHVEDPWIWAVTSLAFARLRQGSVCVDLVEVSDRITKRTQNKDVQELSATTEQPISPWVDPKAWADRITSSAISQPGGPILVDGMLVYLQQYYQAEGEIVDRIALALAPEALETAEIDDLLSQLFPSGSTGADEHADQKYAAKIALTHRLSIITGGPGSGKTTTISRILAGILQRDPGARIALAAPTGKAAARMAESIKESSTAAHFPFPQMNESLQSLPTSTIHRLIGIGYHRTKPKHNERYPLAFDVVIIDEVSMVPLLLMQQLFAAIPPQARIILVGDSHQLQSVDAGNVLADLVGGLQGQSAIATLSRSRRFGGAIGQLAGHILRGETDQAMAVIESAPQGEVQLINTSDARSNHMEPLLEMFDVANEPDSALEPARLLAVLEQQRILCAHREGIAGEQTWNQHAQEWLRSKRRLHKIHGFYVGQPVMVTANDYQLDLYNGDSGIICLHGDKPVVLLDAEPEPKLFPVGRIGHLIAAHALTIHRAQGSQARKISVVLPPADSPLLTRELLYTAVTRAQQSLTLIGDVGSIRAAINRQSQRTTGLADRLRAVLN